MTSREGYDAYTLYLGIKLHFYSKDYNFVRYNGKVKADINSFLKRKDKYHFGKLYKKYKQELQKFAAMQIGRRRRDDYTDGTIRIPIESPPQ